METGEQYPVTLVTAWYKIRRRGESSFRPYEEWMRNLLSYIRWPLVIFCEEQSLDEIRRLRGDKPAVCLAVSPEEFLVHKYRRVFHDQCVSGRLVCHDPDVSMVWNEKCNFARRAAVMNPFRSEMIFWCDIGAFKGSALYNEQMFRLSERVEWPNLRVCRALPRDRVAFTIVSNHPGLSHGLADPSRSNGPAPDDGQPALAVNAAFWGGSNEAVIRWGDAYYEYLERRFREGRLLLAEEPHMSEICIARPELVHLIPRSAVSWGKVAGEASWTHYRWYYLNGGKFPLRYLCREVLPRIGDSGLVKWLVLTLWRGVFRINWKALWPFGGGGNDRGRAA